MDKQNENYYNGLYRDYIIPASMSFPFGFAFNPPPHNIPCKDANYPARLQQGFESFFHLSKRQT